MEPDPRTVRRRLLRWYDANARDLPWRRTKHPYAVLVSEAMLQQTRVETVIPYWKRWMARYPDVTALAAAPEEDVMAEWAGLGYYRRARNLHAAAKRIAAAGRGGDGFPRTAETLRGLPGVGAYTAGAVASIAFGERVPAVDGNVVRVLARLLAVRDSATPAARRRIEKSAAALVAPGRPGDWNQALMDLGATVCTPRNPRCDSCPVAKDCKAFAAGTRDTIPAPRRKPRARVESVRMVRIVRGGKVLVVRPEKGLLAGMWALPTASAATDFAAHVEATTGIRFEPDGRSARVRHEFTHRTWQVEVVAATHSGGRLRADARWIDPENLDGLAVSNLARKAMTAPMT